MTREVAFGDRLAEVVLVYASWSPRRCDEHALMLQAMGVRSIIQPIGRAFALLVEARDAELAREQLLLYASERQTGRPRFESRLQIQDGLICASLYGLTILMFDMLSRSNAFAWNWWQAGMNRAGLVQQGEWWRIFTALTLHGDAVHLAGNLVFGLIFVFLAGGTLGWGVGWAGILLAGGLGNVLAALLRTPDYNSLGASTAVFGAVGILAAVAWKRRESRINRWAPLGGGVALLAFLGMSGERTDILAHVTGLGAGSLLGLALTALETRTWWAGWWKQGIGVAATLFLIFAWILALQTHG